MAEKDKGGSKLYPIHCIIMIALMLSGFFLPAGETITPMGMKALGIFAGLIYGWIFIELIWTSLLGLLMLSFTGYGTIVEIAGQGFGSEIILMVIFFSILTKWLEDVGLTNTIAQWMMSRKVLVGKPYLFITMLFLLTFIVSVFVGIYATIFLMWGICYRVLTNLGYAQRDKTASFILIGVAFVSIMGMVIKPWSPWSLMGVKGLVQATGMNYALIPYSVFMIAMSFASTAIFVIFGKFILRIDVSKLKNADYTNMRHEINYTKEQKIATVAILTYMVLLYASSIMPADFILTQIFKPMGALGMVLAVTVVLCLTRLDHKPYYNFSELASTSIPWSMICLLAAVGPMGSVLMSADAGIVKALTAAVQPLFAGHSALALYIIVCVVGCVITQFMNNTILLVVFTPLLCNISLMFNANPLITAAILIFGLTAALATPGASSRAGMVFGNTKWIDVKQAYLQGILSVVAVMIALICIGIPLGNVLF